jgi:hypothetical protein
LAHLGKWAALVAALALPMAASADAPANLTWFVTNKTPGALKLKFFDNSRKLVSPSATEAYLINRGEPKTYVLSCATADAWICAGAEDYAGHWWGVGLAGDKGCKDCCYRCGVNAVGHFNPVLTDSTDPGPQTPPPPSQAVTGSWIVCHLSNEHTSDFGDNFVDNTQAYPDEIYVLAADGTLKIYDLRSQTLNTIDGAKMTPEAVSWSYPAQQGAGWYTNGKTYSIDRRTGGYYMRTETHFTQNNNTTTDTTTGNCAATAPRPVLTGQF